MKKVTILLFASCFFLSNTINALAVDKIEPLSVPDKYDYPVKPGDPKWAEICDHSVILASLP